MNVLLGFLYILAPLVTLDIVAIKWGADSRDGLHSPEWERRQGWKGFRR